ncbi:MAG: FAD-dependent oxidoreductase [Caldilineaceae bacterium]|nr:FAD-dependent oxidoreductase [Caldilineaceae bacterium]MCB9162634.1 FAD-dependent oxidoreductase [Caldilineaceae bacterium]
MPAPTILIVDDEPQVLNAVERDLRRHYRREYRIVKAGSGQEALTVTQQLKQRNDPVALFLVDQRMPNMTGTEFLNEARAFYPEARKVLLTAYADTEAAIASINRIGLDYYLMKPWDPPEQNMYPILDDLLDAWKASVPVPYDGIRVAGTLWSAASHHTKDFLARNRIPYQWLDIETNAEARALVESVENEHHRLPVVFFPDGRVLVNPENRDLADACGLQTRASENSYDLIIVGAGPAGLGAGVYGASEGLRTLLIDMEATGGQAGTSSRIENYLGFPSGISGADLANRATTQARRLGAEVLTAQKVAGIRVEDPYRIVVLEDGTELTCRALILATGVTVRKLDAPGVERLTGAGIYYGAALTEAANYRDQHVYVVGGANSAGQGAMFFARYAKQVTMVVRGSSLAKGMSQYLVDQIEEQPNIDVLTYTTVTEVHGEDRLEAITMENRETGEAKTVPAAALFLFIGAVPHTDLIRDVVRCNNAGFILTGPDLAEDGQRPKGWTLTRDPYLLETSVPGVFAAGDVRHGAVRRVASAVGQGAIAVSFVHQYLKSV